MTDKSNRPINPLPMRDRQLIASLRQGSKITISILDEDPVIGYLAGWDDDTYFVLQPIEKYDPSSGTHHEDFDKMLIPKQNILFIQVTDERTFREEPLHEEMNKIVKPFLDRINNEHPRP